MLVQPHQVQIGQHIRYDGLEFKVRAIAPYERYSRIDGKLLRGLRFLGTNDALVYIETELPRVEDISACVEVLDVQPTTV